MQIRFSDAVGALDAELNPSLQKKLNLAALSLAGFCLLPFVAVAKTSSFAYSFFSSHFTDPKTKLLHEKLVEYLHQSTQDKLNILAEILNQSLTETEISIVLDILSNIAPSTDSPTSAIDSIKEMFYGANIEIQDAGFLYDKWEKLDGIRMRRSSHNHKKGAGRGLYHPVFKEFLFWKDKTTGNTHFQLEEHSLQFSILGINHLILHIYDCVRTKKDDKQVGPFGRSDFTEERPISFKFDKGSFAANRQKHADLITTASKQPETQITC